MRAIYSSLLCCIFLLAGGQNAFANSLQDIHLTFEAGEYDKTVEQGTSLGTTDGLALAAEALNAKLLLGKAKHKTKTAKHAMKLAKAALVLDPQNADAQIQYALAYGFYGRHASNFKAWRKKLPKKIRAEIDKAATMAPEDVRTQALKGAWHLNLLYKAGSFDVEKRYGASAQAGAAYFQEAIAHSKDDIIISSNFLMLQFALQPEARAEQTKLTLRDTVLTKTPHNDVERQILNQMQNIYAGFETGDALKRAQAFLDQ